MTRQIPIIVIVGPTASGKTALAVKLAKLYNGEIICADSRTVYKNMDIGTAKPSVAEQAGVPHWGFDLIEPGERFSAADFKAYALQKIDEILQRWHTPFLVGGTGLYVDAVLYDYSFGDDANVEQRQELEKLSVARLQEYCRKSNIELPENSQNKRYLIRAIERKGMSVKRNSKPLSTSIIVGIATDKEMLRTRIQKRSEQLFDDGVVEEAIKLGKKYGWENEAMTGNVYRIAHAYLENQLTRNEAIEKNTTADWRLAKRQLTWLRRNNHIKWLSLTEAETYLRGVLATE